MTSSVLKSGEFQGLSPKPESMQLRVHGFPVHSLAPFSGVGLRVEDMLTRRAVAKALMWDSFQITEKFDPKANIQDSEAAPPTLHPTPFPCP